MKTRTFILSEKDEEMLAENGCRSLFDHVTYQGRTEQNHADKGWVTFTAEDIRPEYANLSKRDIEHLLEAHTLERMESLLWGHKLVVSALCSVQADGAYYIQLYLNAGYFS